MVLTYRSEDIARITQVPLENVQQYWPALLREFQARGIEHLNVQIAALATIAIETAHTFRPVREAFWEDEAWRAANLSYYPFYGRGLIQLTHRSNYEAGSPVAGLDLVAEPDRALDDEPAVKLFAWYFDTRGVAAACLQIRDGTLKPYDGWRKSRRLVQGGYAGWPEYYDYIKALVATEPVELDLDPPAPVDVATLIETFIGSGLSRLGDEYVWDGEQPGGFDCSGFVTWMGRQVGIELPSYTDDAYNACLPVPQGTERRGDLIFWHYKDNQAAYWKHMGVWLGDGTTLESRSPAGVAIYHPLDVLHEFRRIPAFAVEPVSEPTMSDAEFVAHLTVGLKHLGDVEADRLADVAQVLRQRIATVKAELDGLEAVYKSVEETVHAMRHVRVTLLGDRS